MALALALGAPVCLTGCSALEDATTPTPTAATPTPVALASPAGPAWTQDLSFTGELQGRMTGIVPNQAGQHSDCTGPNSKTAGNWALTLFGQVGPNVYGVVITANPYRGPGSYPAGPASVEVHTVDLKQVWQVQPGDSVTFRVNNDEQSGTLDATLTDLADAKGKLRVAGSWSCRS